MQNTQTKRLRFSDSVPTTGLIFPESRVEGVDDLQFVAFGQSEAEAEVRPLGHFAQHTVIQLEGGEGLGLQLELNRCTNHPKRLKDRRVQALGM